MSLLDGQPALILAKAICKHTDIFKHINKDITISSFISFFFVVEEEKLQQYAPIHSVTCSALSKTYGHSKQRE